MYENGAFGYDPNNKKLTENIFYIFGTNIRLYNTSHRD